MKENDIIRGLDAHTMTVFIEHPDGSYGPAESGSYMVSNYIDNFAEKQRHFHETAFKDLADGRLSPVGYYCRLREVAPADLAVRARVSIGKINRALDTKKFGSLTIAEAARIADVLGIPLADLFQLPPPGMIVAHQPTPCPWMVRTPAVVPVQVPHAPSPKIATGEAS